ncbi:MAG: hypothetical protein VKJ06_00850 [Vampirovibrionales bacterium]|nr:hypothetical protein [Vampirovibrionales bacterium]
MPHETALATFFDRLNLLPKAFQAKFDGLIVAMVEQIRTDQRLRGEVIRLGADNILKLMAESQSPLWEAGDGLTSAYRAVARLSPSGQAIIINRLKEPVDLILLYCTICAKTNIEPEATDAHEIMKASVNEGNGLSVLEDIVGPDLLKACLQKQSEPEASKTALPTGQPVLDPTSNLLRISVG